jgi:hypothetical protein
MKRLAEISVCLLLVVVGVDSGPVWSAGYRNFKVAVYSRACETREMKDLNWLEPRWNELSRQVKVDKIYLETHRDLIVVDEPTLLSAK